MESRRPARHMPEDAGVATDRMAAVDKDATELTLRAKEHCPDAVVEVPFTRHEDAHLLVFVPKDASQRDREKLREVWTRRSTDILLDTGLLILAGAYEASQCHRGHSGPATAR